MNKLVRVRDDNVIEILLTDGTVHLEVRPGYEERLGPVIHVYRIMIHNEPDHLFTLRLSVVTESSARLIWKARLFTTPST